MSSYVTFLVLLLTVVVGGLILTVYFGALGLVLWIIAFALLASWLIRWARTRTKTS